jgi:hypothetical protein
MLRFQIPEENTRAQTAPNVNEEALLNSSDDALFEDSSNTVDEISNLNEEKQNLSQTIGEVSDIDLNVRIFFELGNLLL